MCVCVHGPGAAWSRGSILRMLHPVDAAPWGYCTLRMLHPEDAAPSGCCTLRMLHPQIWAAKPPMSTSANDMPIFDHLEARTGPFLSPRSKFQNWTHKAMLHPEDAAPWGYCTLRMQHLGDTEPRGWPRDRCGLKTSNLKMLIILI